MKKISVSDNTGIQLPARNLITIENDEMGHGLEKSLETKENYDFLILASALASAGARSGKNSAF